MNKGNIKNKIILFMLYCIFAISVLRYYLSFGEGLSRTSLLITVISAFMVVFLLICYKENIDNLNRNFLRISHVFAAGYVVVHFFAYAAYLFTDVDFIIGSNFVSSKIINEAAINSLVCLVAFVIGYVLTKRKGWSASNIDCSYINYDKYALFFIVIFYTSVDKRYFQGGYGEILNNEGGLSVISVLSQQLIIASFVATSISKALSNNNLSVKEYVKSYSLIYYLSVMIYMFLVASSGDRGPLIQLAMCYFSTFFIINKKKFTLAKAIPLMIVAVFALNFIGVYRENSGGVNSGNMMEANSAMSERLSGGNILFSSTMELSNVVRSYNVIYEETKTHGTINGIGFIDQLLGFFPGLRPYIVYPIFEYDKGKREIDSNYLSTRLLSSDHGMGTSCCADIFYNFGFWGTVIVFCFFGMFTKKMDIELYSREHNIIAYAFAINYLMLAVYLGRGKLLSPLNISIYSFFLIYLSILLSKNKKTNGC